MEPKFSIGQHIINSSKSIAPIQTGTIKGVVTGDLYSMFAGPMTDLWKEQFPHWKEKFVYYVELDMPSKPVGSTHPISKFLPALKWMAFAEDDLSLFEVPTYA